MGLGLLLLLTGLTISAVAIYYSVLGLAAIFAAATLPIYIMGGTLEIAKLVAASWLKANWSRATGFIKWYMSIAVIILMMITSMGIFGFLSKAHLDQSVPTGDIAAKVALIDEKIKTQRDNIEAARTALAQMDAQVNQRLSGTNADQSAERSVQIRKAQAKERSALQNDIAVAQKEIAKLNEERAPVASQLRKVEAEVGPIKYIAQFVYGEAADQTLLEKAVTWVIILIVIVFDPLAVAMLLAAQMTFKWYRDDKEQANAVVNASDDTVSNNDEGNDPGASGSNTVVEDAAEPANTDAVTDDFDPSKHPYLYKGDFWKKPEGWESVSPMVAPEEKLAVITPFTEFKIIDPEITADTTEVKTTDEVPLVEPAESKKKIHDQEQGTTSGQDDQVGYVQNGEQKEDSLWNRVRERISEEFKPKDYLIVVYGKGKFEDFQYDPEQDADLDKFIKDIKNGVHSFGDYPQEKLKQYASRIYELRKN